MFTRCDLNVARCWPNSCRILAKVLDKVYAKCLTIIILTDKFVKQKLSLLCQDLAYIWPTSSQKVAPGCFRKTIFPCPQPLAGGWRAGGRRAGGSRATKPAAHRARGSSPGSSSIGQTLEGSFSAVSKPNFARKYALESSRRDLHNALLCTALQSQIFVKFCQKICKIRQN